MNCAPIRRHRKESGGSGMVIVWKVKYEPVEGINSCEIPRPFTAGRIRLETLTGPGPALISLFMDANGHLLANEWQRDAMKTKRT